MTTIPSTSRFLRRLALFGALLLPVILAGCGTAAGQRALTVFFNRVPAFPEPEQYCQEYEAKKPVAVKGALARVANRSSHLPYEEKRCSDCHKQDKDLGGGLVVERERLCFKCHPDILEHHFVHGPAAEGECLACHLPHSSSYASLLMSELDKVCARCHTEARVASAMHERLGEKGMMCVDCHDPHSGTSKYFLR